MPKSPCGKEGHRNTYFFILVVLFHFLPHYVSAALSETHAGPAHLTGAQVNRSAPDFSSLGNVWKDVPLFLSLLGKLNLNSNLSRSVDWDLCRTGPHGDCK